MFVYVGTDMEFPTAPQWPNALSDAAL